MQRSRKRSAISLVAALLLAIPTAAIAGSVLTPTATVTGASAGAVFVATNNGSGPAMQAQSTGNYAIFAITQSASATALRATDTSKTGGSAIYATSAANTILGSSTLGNGIVGSTASNRGAGVRGLDLSTSGSGGAGVRGISTNGSGVEGDDLSMSTSRTTGVGVRGTSTNGTGVIGSSAEGAGIVGSSGGEGLFSDGVHGDAGHSFGILGTSGADGTGVGAIGSGTALGLGASSQAYYAISALVSPGNLNPVIATFGGTSDSTGRNIQAYDSHGNGVFSLDNAGNVTIAGKLFTAGSCKLGCTATRKIVSYTDQASVPTIEDLGSANLVNGEAIVHIDPAFANAIDVRAAYLVFLTPEGDSRGLYVTGKSPTGFLVRENQGGRSTIPFSYRIVAKPYGSSAQRLQVVEMPRPLARRSALRPR